MTTPRKHNPRKPGRKPGRKMSAAVTFGTTPDSAELWRKTLRRYGIKAAPFYREAIDGAIGRLSNR